MSSAASEASVADTKVERPPVQTEAGRGAVSLAERRAQGAVASPTMSPKGGPGGVKTITLGSSRTPQSQVQRPSQPSSSSSEPSQASSFVSPSASSSGPTPSSLFASPPSLPTQTPSPIPMVLLPPGARQGGGPPRGQAPGPGGAGRGLQKQPTPPSGSGVQRGMMSTVNSNGAPRPSPPPRAPVSAFPSNEQTPSDSSPRSSDTTNPPSPSSSSSPRSIPPTSQTTGPSPRSVPTPSVPSTTPIIQTHSPNPPPGSVPVSMTGAPRPDSPTRGRVVRKSAQIVGGGGAGGAGGVDMSQAARSTAFFPTIRPGQRPPSANLSPSPAASSIPEPTTELRPASAAGLSPPVARPGLQALQAGEKQQLPGRPQQQQQQREPGSAGPGPGVGAGRGRGQSPSAVAANLAQARRSQNINVTAPTLNARRSTIVTENLVLENDQNSPDPSSSSSSSSSPKSASSSSTSTSSSSSSSSSYQPVLSHATHSLGSSPVSHGQQIAGQGQNPQRVSQRLTFVSKATRPTTDHVVAEDNEEPSTNKRRVTSIMMGGNEMEAMMVPQVVRKVRPVSKQAVPVASVVISSAPAAAAAAAPPAASPTASSQIEKEERVTKVNPLFDNLHSFESFELPDDLSASFYATQCHSLPLQALVQKIMSLRGGSQRTHHNLAQLISDLLSSAPAVSDKEIESLMEEEWIRRIVADGWDAETWLKLYLRKGDIRCSLVELLREEETTHQRLLFDIPHQATLYTISPSSPQHAHYDPSYCKPADIVFDQKKLGSSGRVVVDTPIESFEPVVKRDAGKQVVTLAQVVDDFRTLEELLQQTPKSSNSHKPKVIQKDLPVDEWGFVIENDYDASVVEHLRAAAARSSATKETQRTTKLQSLLDQWHNLSEEKRRKLQQKLKLGIPAKLRGETWKKLANVDQLRLEKPDLYLTLKKKESSFESQVHRDVHRTLPKHEFFRKTEGQQALFNTLKAISVYDDDVGYCQGMGFCCALFLLHMNEDDAFYTLVRLIDDYEMGPLYATGFPGLWKCFFIHEQLFSLWLPRLSDHFAKQDVPLSLYATAWYTTVFCSSLPYPYVLRIWDWFMCEGIKALFRVSLAILKILQKELLKADFEQILSLLKDLNKSLVPIATADDLISTAMEFSLSSKRLDKLMADSANHTHS